MSNQKFPFQTSFAFFTIEKSGNNVNVRFNDNLVITLPMCNVWDKDAINKRINQQKTVIIEAMQRITDNESATEAIKRNKELALENKELKEQLANVKVNVCSANVESIFNQCIALMAETYNEKGFTTSRAKQILNKYNEHK